MEEKCKNCVLEHKNTIGFIEKYDDSERQALLYVELPVLLHKILCLSQIPLQASKDLIKSDIEEIKKITNAECESALAHFIED